MDDSGMNLNPTNVDRIPHVAPRITPQDLENLIENEHVYQVPDTTFIVCALTLKNGYIVSGNSRPIDDSNFSYDTGVSIARSNAKEKLWEIVGYVEREKMTKIHSEDIARMAVNVERLYRMNRGDEPGMVWNGLTHGQRNVLTQLVEEYIQKHGFTPVECHERWCDLLRLDGWTYGTVFDSVLKEHPMLVPYEILSQTDADKICFFVAMVSVLVTTAGHLS